MKPVIIIMIIAFGIGFMVHGFGCSKKPETTWSDVNRIFVSLEKERSKTFELFKEKLLKQTGKNNE